MNRGRSHKGGYTILETLIFLAVSSLMFVMAMSFFSGHQARGEYNSAVRDFKVQVDDVINNIATGFYTYPGGVKCIADPTGPVRINAASPEEQGGNQGCVLVGRVLKLGEDGQNERHSVYSVIGRQFKDNSTSVPVTTLNEAQPVLFAPGESVQTNFPDSSTSGRLAGGVVIGAVKYDATTNGTITQVLQPNGFAVGFFSSVDQAGVPAGENARMRVDIAVARGCTNTTRALTSAQFVQRFATNCPPGNFSNKMLLNPEGGVGICLVGGRANNHAWINIGASDSGALTTTIDYRDGRTCSA